VEEKELGHTDQEFYNPSSSRRQRRRQRRQAREEGSHSEGENEDQTRNDRSRGRAESQSSSLLEAKLKEKGNRQMDILRGKSRLSKEVK